MNAIATLPETERARAYFEDKMTFTTGPIELDRERHKDTCVIVDVRAAEDYNAGHIPGAINLPEGTWERPAGLDRERLNVVYCYSQVCHLAARAAVKFAAAGYPVQELEGGFKSWQEHQLDVER